MISASNLRTFTPSRGCVYTSTQVCIFGRTEHGTQVCIFAPTHVGAYFLSFFVCMCVFFVCVFSLPAIIAPAAFFFCIPLIIASRSLKNDVRAAHSSVAWEISPLGGTFPYSDLHTHLVRLKFRLPQNANAILGKHILRGYRQTS